MRVPEPRRGRPLPRIQSDVDAADRELRDRLESGFEEIVERAGEWLACRPGCAECCHGPFPITRLDARRLRAGLARLEHDDAGRAEAIRERARAAVGRLREGYPGDVSTGRPVGDTDRLDSFFEVHADLACPALDPLTGHCEVYDARPVACRTYGPPLRYDDRDASPCRLCFAGAPASVVESCRFEPDPDGRETAILDALGASREEPWETLIAFVLAEPF